MTTAADILAGKVVLHMMQHDLFSQWLGIEVLQIQEGYSKIKMTVRKEMINGFGIVHGGVAFSLADSAFAFACNNRNVLSVALDTSINFIKPVHVDDVLTAEAKELHNGRSTGCIISPSPIKKGMWWRCLKAPATAPIKVFCNSACIY